MTSEKDYSWITTQMFDDKLEEIIDTEGSFVLDVPGVYELLAGHYNNQVLDELDEERRDD